MKTKQKASQALLVKRTGFFQGINQEAALGGAGERSQETEATSYKSSARLCQSILDVSCVLTVERT